MYNKISYNTQMAMYQPNAQNVPNWYKIIQKNINYPYGIILPKYHRKYQKRYKLSKSIKTTQSVRKLSKSK
jgi:hypothetical protein